MGKIKIFADSTCDLSPELIKKNDIGLIPLQVTFGEDSYKDGVDLTVEELYKKVEQYGKLPKTASPSLADMHAAFEPYIKEGYDLIFVGISSKLSSTLQNVAIIANEFDEGRIEIIDSLNLSTGIGLLIMKAVDYVKEGLGIKEIAAKVREQVSKVETEFIIDTLEYLYKGGRCSALQNFFGSMLKIRPVVKVVEGRMILADKVRGKRERVLNTLLNNAMKNKEEMDLDRIFVTHSLADEDAEFLKKELESNTKAKEVIITRAGSVISSHCGPNTVGILYIKN